MGKGRHDVELIDSIMRLLSYPFMVRALIAGLAISFAAALLGLPLVLRRYSMIGDGLSHVGFGALAIAAVMNLAPLAVAIPVVVLAAFALLGINEKLRARSDAAIAVVSTGALAVGVVAISMSGGINTDVYSYMFGSIFALSDGEAAVTAVVCFSIGAVYLVLIRRFFAVAFDESFARSAGINVGAYNMLLAAMTAVTIVLGMRMMGALMITALTTIPALTSMKLAKSYIAASVAAMIVGVGCALGGILCSYYFASPPGASVVLLNIAVLAVVSLAKLVTVKTKNK